MPTVSIEWFKWPEWPHGTSYKGGDSMELLGADEEPLQLGVRRVEAGRLVLATDQLAGVEPALVAQLGHPAVDVVPGVGHGLSLGVVADSLTA